MPTNGDWDFYLMKVNFFKRAKFKIITATAITIFTLASTFTATIAWFEANMRLNVAAGNFTVVGPDQVSFDLYYLSSFTDAEDHTKNGNYNPNINYFSGYETAYEDATFTKVNFLNGSVTNSPDPTDIRHLWPAHKLTFAIVVKTSTIEKFSLIDWGENEGHEAVDAAKTSVSQYVRLSWAIDIYGAAYSVSSTGDTDEAIATDVSTGFSTYFADDSLTDVFTYSESSLAPISPKNVIDVVYDVPVNSSGYRTIVYFTVEFSDAASTHYTYNEGTGYYTQDNDGDSNCYERLFLDKLDFELS